MQHICRCVRDVQSGLKREGGRRQLNGTLKAAAGCCQADPAAGNGKEAHKQQRLDWMLLKTYGSLCESEVEKDLGDKGVDM